MRSLTIIIEGHLLKPMFNKYSVKVRWFCRDKECAHCGLDVDDDRGHALVTVPLPHELQANKVSTVGAARSESRKPSRLVESKLGLVLALDLLGREFDKVNLSRIEERSNVFADKL